MPTLSNGVFGAIRRPGPLGLGPMGAQGSGPEAWSSPLVSGEDATNPRLLDEFGGYFTIERHLRGLGLSELEATLGFREGLLAAGVLIYVFKEQPKVGQFVFAGSTRYSNAEGLVAREQRLKAASMVVPGAWLNERLVKVVPLRTPPAERDSYPIADSPVEQWQLLVQLPAELVCVLKGDRRYFPR